MTFTCVLLRGLLTTVAINIFSSTSIAFKPSQFCVSMSSNPDLYGVEPMITNNIYITVMTKQWHIGGGGWGGINRKYLNSFFSVVMSYFYLFIIISFTNKMLNVKTHTSSFKYTTHNNKLVFILSQSTLV